MGLPTASQQLIEIAKALTLNAKLLILDEPTAALGSAETKLLFKQIETLKSEGVGIIYISHRLEEIKRIADRIVVLRDGHKVEEFGTADLPVRTIVEAMVGRSMDRMFPSIPTPGDQTVLEVRDLSSASGAFSGVNFEVKKGEILGIAGLVGAGPNRSRACYRGRRSDCRRSGLPRRKRRYAAPSAWVDQEWHRAGSRRPEIARSGAEPQHPGQHHLFEL